MRLNEKLYEICGAYEQGGIWHYRLEPWDDAHTIRALVEWSEEKEKEFIRWAEEQKRKKKLSRVARPLQILLGFLPARHQARLSEKVGLNPPTATYLSSLFEMVVSLSVLVLSVIDGFCGMYGAGPVFKIPVWVVVLVVLTLAEGTGRLIYTSATSEPVGSLLLSFLDLKLKRTEKKDYFKDDRTRAGTFFMVQTPVEKKHWEKWGGIQVDGENFAFLEKKKLLSCYLYRFDRSGKKFPLADPEKERRYNIASDKSYVLAPFWGYLPRELQLRIAEFGRYTPFTYVRVSILINAVVSVLALASEIHGAARGVSGIWTLVSILFYLFLLGESLSRLYKLYREDEITGSFLGILVKPFYYMCFEEVLE